MHDFAGNRSSRRGGQKRRPLVMMGTRDTLSKTRMAVRKNRVGGERSETKCLVNASGGLAPG